jgi:nucleotide-binding universal stress UspA family protein
MMPGPVAEAPRDAVFPPWRSPLRAGTLESDEHLGKRRKDMGGTIVCGVTDSAGGRGAAELAGALAGRLGLRLVLVNVVDGLPPAAHESLTARQRQAGATRLVAEIAREVGGGPETRVAAGDRAEALAQAAAEEGADLIVVGSRSAGFTARNVRCTLARELEAATPVPVLVAPPSTRKRSTDRLAVAAAR